MGAAATAVKQDKSPDRRRRRREECPFARFALRVYAEWFLLGEDRGWPRESTEARAAHQAQTKTETEGIGAYRGRVEMGSDWRGRPITVPREPPRMPRDTRTKPGTQVPDIDRARLGPEVARCLRDLPGDVAIVLHTHYVRKDLAQADRIRALELRPAAYWRLHEKGLWWIDGRLSGVDWRRPGRDDGDRRLTVTRE